MRSVATVVAAAAVAQLVSAGGLTTSCKVEIRKGMSFDLSPLRQGTLSPNGVYVADKATMYSVNDTAGGGVGREYLYNFNFCGAVEPTAQCKAKGADIPLPAFQSDVAENGFCYRLSNQTKLGWQFEAYDNRFPSRGVTISYVGGDSAGCFDENYMPIKRAISLKLRCSNDPSKAHIGDDELVVEKDKCRYDLYLSSLYGCPTQCIKGTTLCGNQGVCGYDSDAQAARCFCNTGFEGADCKTVTQPSNRDSVETGLLIFMVCLLVLAVLVVGYMLLRLRRLTVDPAAYGELAGRFNELGMVTA